MTAEVEERIEAAPAPDQDEPIRRAKQRAEAIQGLYIHIIVYLVMNAGLFVINLLTRGDGGTWWFYWPLAIWAIALVIHAVVTLRPCVLARMGGAARGLDAEGGGPPR